jgi:membrane protease YdiL (CAAX protease family)
VTFTPRAALVIALASELVYIAGRALIRGHMSEEIPRELVTTAWRIAFIGWYAWLFAGAIREAWRAPAARPVHPLLWIALGIAVVPVPLAGYASGLDAVSRIVFALTTPFVALREEIFYRFILQNALERRLHPLAAILVSTALFVAYHAGAQPMGIFSVLSLTAGGLLLGVAYQRTRSLKLVVVLHLVMDLAFLASIPVIAYPWVVLANLVVVIAALLAWSLDSSKH